ncbi:hypothetical protein HMPREF1872_01376 [Amygdalobacter nucleatus]|uniref:Uncharacterized protein n=1 Tax=Amygdalobacter nucleatus TaxID=3029274 RepID=A0A133Y6R0_9FIRM|nr:hypothetical protein HMPREF1872_01376 [Amygdalobacter nucleatus]
MAFNYSIPLAKSKAQFALKFRDITEPLVYSNCQSFAIFKRNKLQFDSFIYA